MHRIQHGGGAYIPVSPSLERNLQWLSAADLLEEDFGKLLVWPAEKAPTWSFVRQRMHSGYVDAILRQVKP